MLISVFASFVASTFTVVFQQLRHPEEHEHLRSQMPFASLRLKTRDR
jgi:hypothetical protein